MGFFRESGLKSSPPFGKGRTGGISEPKFQKAKMIQNFELQNAKWKNKGA